MDHFEKTLKTEPIFKGAIFDVERVTIELPNGKTSTRDILRNPGASVVVPVLDDSIILVKQYRKPVEKVFIELPAGKLEEGEDPMECAARELEEETGYKAKNLKKLTTLHPAPAFADEILHIYLATGLTRGEANPDEEEFITAEAYKMDQVLTMIEEGIITDAKTVAGVLFAHRIMNKDR